MIRIAAPFTVFFLSLGCGEREMGPLEALAALQQSARSSQGAVATQEPIEVSTEFTIGAGLEAAAAELQAFWESQADCNEVTRDGTTTWIDWGELGDGCEHRGRTYAGLTGVTVTRADGEGVEVEHEWLGFHNEDVRVDGGAVVTWSGASRSRRVVTDHTWTTLDGETADVRGEHEVAARDDGTGFTLVGERDWDTDGGTWRLDLQDIGFRLQDPLPETGRYVVTSPENKTLTIAFDRVDESTIEAVLTGVRGGDLVYHVSRSGSFDRVE